ncbi:hypothetical protein GCM10027284_20200 [Cyclobacterium sediminis]
MNSDKIHQIWKNNIFRFNDAIRSDKAIFNEFIELDRLHSQRISNNISFFKKEKHFLSLSEHKNYQWLFDPKSYTFGAEVFFQFRVLTLLINYIGFKNILSIPPIVVREAVVPTMRLSFPTAIFLDEISFIVLPMGWLDMNNYLGFGIKQVNEKKTMKLEQSIQELQLRFFSDEILQEHLLRNFHLATSQSMAALIKIELSIRLKKQVSFFKDAHGDILPNTFTGLYQRFAYGCESFTLAHEIAHIINNEHKIGATPDEYLADETAISILLNSNSETVMGGGLNISKELSLLFSNTLFNLLGNIHFKLLSLSEYNSNAQKEEFKNRSLETGKKILKLKLSESESKTYRTFLMLLKEYSKTFDTILSNVKDLKTKLYEEGDKIVSSIFEEEDKDAANNG